MAEYDPGWPQKPEVQDDYEVFGLIVIELILLAVMIFVTFIPEFVARKSVHAGSGLLLLFLDSRNFYAQIFVYCISVTSIVTSFELFGIPNFRFAKKADIGITVYLLLVCTWYYVQFPANLLAPVFFADPLGAIVGKAASRNIPDFNPAWIGTKTVMGSATVCIAIYLCLFLGPNADHLWPTDRLLISIAGMFAEALGGDYDNLCIAAVVLGIRFYFAPWV